MHVCWIRDEIVCLFSEDNEIIGFNCDYSENKLDTWY